MNILLTGASRGIGAATREALTSSGHRVAGHSTRGGDGLVAGDLADPQSARKIWNEALTQLDGRIDVLVNNAGIYEGVDLAPPTMSGRRLGPGRCRSTCKRLPTSAGWP